ncbi:uncharacterized protein EAE97_001962 [Botrytis byssoidea]|uniref:Uncharacterized protein n=1 Tax=Botrytis byssoidea TaxID=139641 RepID=A0A9P5IXA3_9HELO|nr:uncharacterized protein EAE97_001962 [Botrytis byssoidea]KAF7952465.1 hypothetical protein EAE97_001962 [Botrytis byssoidea]
MYWTTAFSAALSLSAVADAATVGHLRPRHERCPSINGSFSFDIFQLYPENSAFDPVRCKFYLSSIYNASIVGFDLFTADHQVLTFPGITHTKPYHMAGVDYDVHSGAMFFTATSGLAFETNGGDLSGPQKVTKWDTTAMEAVYIADLAPFQEQYESAFGHVTAGFQDIAEDSNGNSYAQQAMAAIVLLKSLLMVR